MSCHSCLTGMTDQNMRTMPHKKTQQNYRGKHSETEIYKNLPDYELYHHQLSAPLRPQHCHWNDVTE